MCLVLFIATSERLFTRLKDLILEIKDGQAFGLINWETWQKGNDRVLLLRRNEKETDEYWSDLAEIKRRLDPKPPSPTPPEPTAS